ncbi:hypothetical protein [Chitinasiproducens palmae]|uniref:Uncharacterized protein n=1 Tax=Chitinasiproducens palmae TaxID=1770053 RepID=A0A1H2PTR7_9BURK|nr:hypothetical protein [Chitinasiproducens palmae]SDV49678.1 hypothetical protein SAMN05216551_10943 [Chitinasiproducens palmae]
MNRTVRGDHAFRMTFACTALACCIALFAALLPIGHWQDEYAVFPHMREGGLDAVWSRVLHWSPRPFSEGLIYVYSLAVFAFGRPLIGAALALAWLLFAVLLLLPARWAPRGVARRALLLLALAIWCGCLLGHPVAEFFYWPMATLAYVPTVATLAFVCLTLIASGMTLRGSTRPILAASTERAPLLAQAAGTSGSAADSGAGDTFDGASDGGSARASVEAAAVGSVGSVASAVAPTPRAAVPPCLPLCVALAVAATSTEVGAMFVAAFGLLVVVASTLDRGALRALKWVGLPVVLAFGVIGLLYFGRVTQSIEVMGQATVAHHLAPALRASVHAVLVAMVSLDGTSSGVLNVVAGLAVKGLFTIGCRRLLAPFMTPPPASHAAPAMSLHRLPAVGMELALPNAGTHEAAGPGASPAGIPVLLAAFACACLGVVALSIGAAFYQFGLLCCERHDTFRQCLVYLGLASAAAAWAAGRRHRRCGVRPGAVSRVTAPRPVQGASLLLAGAAIAFLAALPALHADFRSYRRFAAVRAQNWQAGRAPGDTMSFAQHPPGRVVGGMVVEQGRYERGPNTPAWIDGVLMLFGKRSVTLK